MNWEYIEKNWKKSLYTCGIPIPKTSSNCNSKLDNSHILITTLEIQSILRKYLETLYYSTHIAEQESAKDNMINDFCHLAESAPVLYPMNLSQSINKGEMETIINNVFNSAQKRYTLSHIPVSIFRDSIQHNQVVTPSYLPWQIPGNKQKNFVINYSDDASKQKAINTLNQMVMTILLAFPIKKVHITILDMEMASDLVFLTGNLDKQLVSHVIDERGLSSLVEYLKEDMLSDASTAGFTTQEEYNESQKKIEGKYELVLIPSTYGAHYARLQETLLPFFQNAQKNGTYFFVLNDTTQSSVRPDADHILKHTDVYQLLDATTLNDFSSQDNAIIKTTSFANDPVWSKAMFEYINNMTSKKMVYSKNWRSLAEETSIDLYSTISVPIGVDKSGNVQNFVLDCGDHTNAFVLGNPGRGKSVLLQDILYNMVLSYSPNDLELYLMDFKQGGVEFSPYKDMPHVRALMVDGNDEQVTISILNHIDEQMEIRGKKISSAGVKNIEEYNRKNPNHRLPQIVLIVDECQDLFKESLGSRDTVISQTIASIARKGRNQGVHFVFATQTLSGLNISSDVKKIISDHYLLNCDQNTSDEMVPNSSKITSGLETGEVLFHNGNTRNEFRAYFSKNDVPSEILMWGRDKFANIRIEKQFYYSGSIQKRLALTCINEMSTNHCSMAWGEELSLEQGTIISELMRSSNQNTLVCGINNQLQASCTTMAGVVSFAIQNKREWLGFDIYILNCVVSKDKRLSILLNDMEQYGLCKLVNIEDAGDVLLNLCKNIASSHPKESLFVILGFENFDDLQSNSRLSNIQKPKAVSSISHENTSSSAPNMYAGTEVEDASFDDPDEEWQADPTAKAMYSQYSSQHDADSDDTDEIEKLRTYVGFEDCNGYQDAMQYVLSQGPKQGIFSVIQTDVPRDLSLGVGAIKIDLFAHRIYHKLEESAVTYDNALDNSKLHLDRLSDSPERPRAYYYSKAGKRFELMIPFAMPEIDEINNLINQ